jgi:hypothetical protein
VNPYPDLAGIAANLLVLSANHAVPSRPNSLSLIKSTAGVSGEMVSVLASWVAGTTLIGHANTVQNVHSYLRAILPEQLDRELLARAERLPGLIELDKNAQYLSLAMFLISNNMLEAENFNKIVEYLEHQRDRLLLRSLLSVKASTVDAFAEKLLIASVKSGKTMIAKVVLDAGIDPNL